MKKIAYVLLALAIVLTSFSCFEDLDDNPQYSAYEVKDFIWSALNLVYLYKDDVPDLADDRFVDSEDYQNYLNSYASPEDLFDNLIYQPQTVDRFSILFPDYIALEQLLNGTTVSNGLEFNLYYKPNSSTELYAVIRLVLNNSEASDLGLERGQIVSEVNGSTITVNNYQSLFAQNSYTLSFATYNDNSTPETTDDNIEPSSESVTLNKVPYNENPVYLRSVIELDNGEKLGYLMYNGFYGEYNNQLNDAFGYFQSNNVDHLVLDLRYNGGGSVVTAGYLASMVTGQFTGDVFAKMQYNSNFTGDNYNINFSSSMSGGSAINSLNLDKVYAITTGSSASASELVINSLKPYIEVVQVGDTSTGKSQFSTIIYDSPELTDKNNINFNHNYAMLPLIGITVNVNDTPVPSQGLEPTIVLEEVGRNYGILGNENEPLLAEVINHILNGGRQNNVLLKPETKQLEVNINKTLQVMYE